jgi:hypothetical protein
VDVGDDDAGRSLLDSRHQAGLFNVSTLMPHTSPHRIPCTHAGQRRAFEFYSHCRPSKRHRRGFNCSG